MGTPAERRAELDEQFAIRTAEDVAKELGEMKGVLMKAGQLVSFIFEALPEDAQAALATLQADAAPMAPSLAAGVVTAELGNPPERVFLDWTDLPVAAASIGQVHRAITAGGLDVAVKVQYPGVGEAIESDLDAAEMMYAMFSMMMLKGLDAKAFVDELRARMREELDYELEARNVVEFSALYAGHPWVRVPRLVPELSTKRLLTTEWVDGMSFEQFRATGSYATKQRAAEVLWRFAQHAVLRCGMFNGDPHPGNYKFHHDGSITFLDYGLVKRWTPGEWESLSPTLDAIVVHRDPDALVAAMETAGFLRPGHGLRARGRLRVREQPLHAVPHRRVHVQPGVDARDAQRDLRHPGPARRGDRAAQHATDLRDPRSRGLGRERDPGQARSACTMAGDAPRVHRRRRAGDRAGRRRSRLARRPLPRLVHRVAGSRRSRWPSGATPGDPRAGRRGSTGDRRRAGAVRGVRAVDLDHDASRCEAHARRDRRGATHGTPSCGASGSR